MNYFVFTDEAGAYQRRPSDAHIRSHPFYIRSNVLMSIDDYRQYQIEMQRISGEYEIPYDEEIKWSDLWSKTKNKPRNDFIKRITISRLKGYYRKVFETAISKNSLRFMFTVTDIVGKTCDWSREPIYKSHLQDAFQRIQMDMGVDDFATFIMDELNEETLKQIKTACHAFTVKGDFVNYKNIYQGVLTENSLYSPSIQLADYAAGVMNGYLRGKIVSPGKYQFATDLFNEFIQPHIRRHFNGKIVGYGVVDIPKRTAFRDQLEAIFDV
ncbi:MAG: DUF3800 domain-containing protein [Clostridia bacterium]|nr:DUF3800 domain-containing protein [Clostridia bacterium]